MSNRTFLITGAAGFFGAHLIEHILKTTDDRIIGTDCLNYAGTWDRLRDIEIPLKGLLLPIGDVDDDYQQGQRGAISAYDHPRFTPLVWDFRQPAEENLVKELKNVTHIVHAGGLTHVDSSITDPRSFVISNVLGTCNVLELARQLPKLELFHYCSTDEVYGPALMSGPGFHEHHKHNPKNPYAAAKSGGQMLVNSYANTYGIPCIATNLMNLFGERQNKEKFIPLCIKAALEGGHVKIHGTPDRTQAGKRTYIHCRNAASAFTFLYNSGVPLTDKQTMDVFNIVGEKEVDNLSLANMINEYVLELGHLKGYRPIGMTTEIVDFHSSRPGHDLAYRLDGMKMRGIGWTLPKTFNDSLRKTVDWYLDNQKWLN